MSTALKLTSLLVLCAALGAACSSQPQPEPAPSSETNAREALMASIEKMAGIGYAASARFSPDGQQVAYLSPAGGVPQVWVVAIGGTGARQVTRFDDQVGGVEWSPDGRTLAVSVAPGGGLNSQLYLMEVDGSEPQRITRGGEVNNWLGFWSDDGRFLTYSSNAEGDGNMHVYVYDRVAEASRIIARNQGIGTAASLSPSANRAVIWRMKSRGNTDLFLMDIEGGREQILTAHEGVALSNDAEFLDEDTLFLSTNVGRETMALARVDIDAEGTARPLEYVAVRARAELGGFRIVDERTIAIVWNVGGRSELEFFDIEDQTVSSRVELPAEIITGLDTAAAGGEMIMTLMGSATPQDVWVLDANRTDLRRVTQTDSNGVDLASLVRPELRRYAAHDGLELSGWLYQPRNRNGKGPVVLSFHGGPEGQERPFFRSVYQALASQGITVFAPNVRGSSGFGKTFVNLDNGALRVDAVKDIESTAKYVIEQGIADPARIGIMGGSYGGYMVMAGLTEFPDLFAAGANLFGIVNFETFFSETEAWMAAISKVEYGDPDTEADMLRSLSPIHKLDRVKAPTIVLHGANDTNVPVVEAEQVVDALEQRGVPVNYVLFADEGHGWRKTENRVTSDFEIVRWFAKYL